MRPLLACLAAALTAAGAPALCAGESPASSAAAASAASMPARAKVPEDPLDRVRERLAEKLGGTNQVDASKKGEVRVVNRGGNAEPSAAAGRAAPPASAASASSAPRAAAASSAGAKRERAKAETTAVVAAPPPVPWGYEGPGGPANWGALKPEFATCASGARQSPIDIRGGIKVQLEPVLFDYRPSSFRVVDTGHTVQVDVGPGNAIEVLGRRYELQHFHFHRPSEERIDGRQSDMSVHLFHKDGEGRLGVVAVLIEQGRAHPVVQAAWNNLPLDRGEEVTARTTLDPAQLLPEDRGYFTYMGSLTTPPCSEGVLWMVMRQPVQVSAEQIDIFARLHPMNARPVQAANGRLIKESE